MKITLLAILLLLLPLSIPRADDSSLRKALIDLKERRTGEAGIVVPGELGIVEVLPQPAIHTGWQSPTTGSSISRMARYASGGRTIATRTGKR